MMRIISFLIVVFAIVPVTVNAKTDIRCLDESGGAGLIAACYQGLINDLSNDNKYIFKKIYKNIPINNINRSLIKKYMRQQISNEQYCELSRKSLTAWVNEKRPPSPRFFDYDESYYQCLYNIKRIQNVFLKSLLNDDQ